MLLPGEDLNLVDEEVDSTEGVSDDEIAARYVRGEVRIVTEQGRTQLAELPSVLDSGRWELKPDFQRRERWDEGRQSRLVESFIMNVPVPPIFLYEYEYSKYQVMDGLQRLTALRAFYSNELRLQGLDYWQELEGRTYSDLPEKLKQGIDRRFISTIVLLYETAESESKAEELKQLVFERINSGGEPLTPQESRNAVSKGPLNDLLPKLARTPSFCRLWAIPEPDADELADPSNVRAEVLQNQRYRQMEDVEMVLRFFAHRQRATMPASRRFRLFLDEYWSKANTRLSRDVVENVGRQFVATVDLVEKVLGSRAFYIRRTRNGRREWVPRATLLAYDSVMSAFSKFTDVESELIAKKDEVAAALERTYDVNEADFDGRKTDTKDVARRDELIEAVLRQVLAL